MNLLNNALIFTLKALLDFLTILFLLRFYFQLIKIPFQNQMGQLVVALTNFAVKPARRIIPSFGKFDLATFLLAFLSQILLALATILLSTSPWLSMGAKVLAAILVMATFSISSLIIMGFIAGVLLFCILGWVHPYSPAMPFLQQFSDPVLRSFRKITPLIANLDLSPFVFTIVAQLLLYILDSIEPRILANLLLM
jgi:YggT family protein